MKEISRDDFNGLVFENIAFSGKTAAGNTVIVKIITSVLMATVTYKVIFESAKNSDENDMHSVNSFPAMRQLVNHLLQNS
ncbi:hypothetical protein FDI40_gp210 [Agrobacterium phage Atu_ph07]|uniref:Uncharacterized protein n=1 Tax=Agrobacterium phage Atu_ph07 TaxID=2024264 RepID=A0A2L0UZJ2_9CAUD|nr:hypothetical protein FDI40_gp210 [Agrobacterium phage Atu_ph07]AUZ94992.1 hypothetical protein [Agrobacterium phage Atu_ph07]